MEKLNGLKVLACAAILAAVAAPAVAADAVVVRARYLPDDVVCNHLPCPGDDGSEENPRFRIMRGMDPRVLGLSKNIESGDTAAASASLAGIFESGVSGSEASAVSAGGSRFAYPAAKIPALKKSPRGAELTEAGWKGCVGGYLAGGAAGCGIGSATEDGFNEGMDRLGDYLRDRNDK